MDKLSNFMIEAKIKVNIYGDEGIPDIDEVASWLFTLLSEDTDDVEEVQVIKIKEIKNV